MKEWNSVFDHYTIILPFPILLCHLVFSDDPGVSVSPSLSIFPTSRRHAHHLWSVWFYFPFFSTCLLASFSSVIIPIYLRMTLQSDSIYRKWQYHVMIISCGVFFSRNMTHQDLSESHRCDFQLTTCSPNLQSRDWLFSPVGSAVALVSLLRPLSSHHR